MKKCIFCVPFGNLLGHIVCREGMLVDPAKVAVILNMPPPTSSSSCKLPWDILDITIYLSGATRVSQHHWNNYLRNLRISLEFSL
jgi:hypothetical protein